MSDKNKALAEEWFNSAISDYKYAEIGLKENQIFPQIAFLSQQVVEKLLKGFLILNGKEPSRIHDLTLLLDECLKYEQKLKNIQDACELLTGFYIETRYPPDIPNYTQEDILTAFENAKQVKETFEQIVNLFKQ